MGGRDLVFALAPEAGQGAVRKVDVEGAMLEQVAITPTPSPSPQGGGEQPEQAVGLIATTPTPTPNPSPQGGGEKITLMARVQALYEDSAVPVREIARLCGVTERTLYRYVEKGRWRRRYVARPRGEAAAAGNRGRRWQRAPGHEGIKGAGGRFVPCSAAGQPVAHGIKALDPLARERAATACAAASARAAKARAKADERQVWDARVAAINAVSAAMAAYNRFRASRAAVRTPMEMTADEQMEAYFVDQIAAALDCVRRLKL